MKSAKRRKQISLKIKLCEVKRISGKSSRISRGSFRLRYINILILTAFCASSAVDVTWDAKLPAFFGNITYLQCTISGATFDCNKSPRQWYGGPIYDSLCYEDKCTDSNKYEVMNQSRCSYTLMIHNFSDQDVNCEYTCLYGITNMRRNLTLDEKKFIYDPHLKDILEKTTENGKKFNWKINISKIFPAPSCGADLNGHNMTDHVRNSVTKPGFYFAADLQINLQLPLCGKLDVYCYLVEHKINISSKNFDSCNLQGAPNGSKEINVTTLVLSICAVVVISIIACCVYRKRKTWRR